MFARVIDMEPGMRFACGGDVHELVSMESRPQRGQRRFTRVHVKVGDPFTVDRAERFPVFGWRG